MIDHLDVVDPRRRAVGERAPRDRGVVRAAAAARLGIAPVDQPVRREAGIERDIEKGHDYGWPTIAYGIEYRGAAITGDITQKEGMEQPRYYWDPVIGPSGMAFYTADLFPAWKGSLFIGGHATNDLVRLTVDGESIVGEERLLENLRESIRDVRQGPDGAVYLLTDSSSGKLLKLIPKR